MKNRKANLNLIDRLLAELNCNRGYASDAAPHSKEELYPDMVMIPAGSFMMGSPETELGRDRNESPQHRVEIKRFALGKIPVTQRQWAALMGFNPSYFSFEPKNTQENHPVEQVNWFDAQEYVMKLRSRTGKPYRLPTESEWEYAARAGSNTAYPWGNHINHAYAHYDFPDEAIGTQSVPSHPANAFGLYNMTGNVWEWVEDADHDDYSGAPDDGSAWKDGQGEIAEIHVLRGGSWDLPAEYVRCASRMWGDPLSKSFLNGFRVALSLSDEPVESPCISEIVRGEVQSLDEHIALSFGDLLGVRLPIARLSSPFEGKVTVQFLIEPATELRTQALSAVIRELGEYLLAAHVPDNWLYARYHCYSSANSYSRVQWSYHPVNEEHAT